MRSKNTIELPLKIKRIRDKSFTTKRRNYKMYQKAKWNWMDVFKELDELKNKENKFIKNTSVKYGIVYNTLKTKYNNYKNNKINDVNIENRGGHNKKLNDTQEKKLYEHIITNYIDTNEVLNNDIVKEIIKDMFKKENINVSNWWVSNFKKRWNMSTQKIKPSKVAVNSPTEIEKQKFLNECNEYKNKIKAKFFLIMMKQITMLLIFKKLRLE
jgi:transposase